MQSGWAYMQSGTYTKVQVWTKSRTSGLGYGLAPCFWGCCSSRYPLFCPIFCTIVNPVYFSVFLLPCITLLHLFIYSDLRNTTFESIREPPVPPIKVHPRGKFACYYWERLRSQGLLISSLIPNSV